MLPRSWLLQLVHHSERPLRQDHVLPLLGKLFERIPSLLECMYNADRTYEGTYSSYRFFVLVNQSFSGLMFEGRSLNTFGFLVRQIFIARICKALALRR
jgi:hypothetical protein